MYLTCELGLELGLGFGFGFGLGLGLWLAQGGLQARGVEGALGAEDERGDLVLDRLRRVLVLGLGLSRRGTRLCKLRLGALHPTVQRRHRRRVSMLQPRRLAPLRLVRVRVRVRVRVEVGLGLGLGLGFEG